MNITINIPENSVDNAVVQGKKITVYFPVQETTIVTVLEKGVLFGIQGAQGIQGIQGVQGAQGIQGIPGIGIAAGGSIGQVLKKASATDYDTAWLTLDKTAVGLSNVDNTSDANKPISNATQTALNGKQATISLTTTGSSGASTFAANVLNIPTYSLSGLGGQPLNTNLTSISALTYASTSFVKMTAAGTFALDTNTYLTAESDTLASVTGRGNVTTNAITVGGLTVNSQSAASVPIRINLAASQTGNALEVANSSGTVLGRITGSGQLSTNTYFNLGGSGSIQIGTDLIIGTANTQGIQMFQNTRNIVFQNGGTFTDSGFRLDVNGTARIQNQLTTTGSITAASAIARGVYMNNTLVAAANNDVLVGLDINPTFTNGSFTGVKNYALRITGSASISDYVYTNNGIACLQNANYFINFPSYNSIGFVVNTAEAMRITSNANVLIGTTTNAGYRLDVVGADSRFNGIRVGLGAGNIGTNLVVGNGALNTNTTGTENVAIGSSSMAVNTTGIRNIAIGDTSLYSNISGSTNVAIGMSSQRLATNANHNVSIGFASLNNNGSGSSNVAIGSFAGRYISGGSTIATSIANSILIGTFAYPLADSQSNQIVIGTNTVGLGSNTTIIGNSSTVTTALYGNLLLGTTTATGAGLTVSNAIAASGSIGRGVYFNQTLTAAANNDVLVGLDINPTFTNGSFTTNNYGLRVTGNIVPSADNLYSLGTSPLRFASVVGFQSIFTYYYAPSGQASYFGSSANTSINFPINNTVYARFHATTGNLTLQNGGTFTDSGFRLDVNGTARIQNALTLGNLATDPTGANGMIYYNTTSNVFRKYINGAWANL